MGSLNIKLATWNEWLAFRRQLEQRYSFESMGIKTIPWVEPLTKQTWRELRVGKSTYNLGELVPVTITSISFTLGKIHTSFRYLYITLEMQ
jgi:hypothetical protein